MRRSGSDVSFVSGRSVVALPVGPAKFVCARVDMLFAGGRAFGFRDPDFGWLV
jgi:hypothetical protein